MPEAQRSFGYKRSASETSSKGTKPHMSPLCTLSITSLPFSLVQLAGIGEEGTYQMGYATLVDDRLSMTDESTHASKHASVS
jgi:hypothetical protein